jgi:hypothetical protein
MVAEEDRLARSLIAKILANFGKSRSTKTSEEKATNDVSGSSELRRFVRNDLLGKNVKF